MRDEDIDPESIETVNVISQECMHKLGESMQKNGWLGRRLLVEEVVLVTGPEYYAWTGSHRIEAARLAGLKTVPCCVIEADEADRAFTAAGYAPNRGGYQSWQDCVVDSRLDLSRLEAVKKAGLDRAVELMEQEIDVESSGG